MTHLAPHPLQPALHLALLAVLANVAGQAQAQNAAPEQIIITGERLTDYQPGRSSAATKGEAAWVDTPMAVSTVTEQAISDRRASNALDAVRLLSGVQGQPGSFYDQFQLRGFGSGYGVSFRNGLQLEGVADAVNMAFVDRIELVKGPSSMLYGRVEPGGFVNVVTKRPQVERALVLEQQFGSWGNRQTTLDATGALTDDGQLSARLIANLDQGDTFYKYQHHDNRAGLAELSWRPSARFELTAGVEGYDVKTAGRGPNTVVPHIGNRPDSSISRSASGSDPTMWKNFPDTVQRQLYFYDWTLQLAEGWKLTQRLHYQNLDEEQTGLSDWGGTWGFIDNPLHRDNFHTNLDLSGSLTLAGVRHELLLGVDAYRYTDKWWGYVGTTTIPVVYHGQPGYTDFTAQLRALQAESANNVLWKSLEADNGLYLQDRMVLNEAWSLLLGGRWDRAWQSYASTYGADGSACYPNCTGQAMNTWPSDTAFSPRAAALYKLSPQASVYASAAKSFGTNNSRYLSDGSYVPPEEAKQFELGFKSQLLEGRLSGSATLFDLTKSNVLAEDPSDRTRQIAIGEVNSRGLELELAGQLNPQWGLTASYTYNPVKITRDTNTESNQGHRRAGTPLHAGAAWLKYDSASVHLPGWSAGLGLQANGERQGDDANSWQMPGYVLADAMAGWRQRWGSHWLEAQLNIKNLFDRHYFDQISYGNASWGAPRSLEASLKVAL